MRRALITVSVLTRTLLGSYTATHVLNRGQLTQEVVPPSTVKYRTMLDMTFPEFEAAAKKTDIVLVPIGAIEEHSSHLPLGTDAMNATAQTFQVHEYLRKAGFDTIVGPPLNIGITNEGGDWTRDGTYAYPGSLTISKSTFVALYVDVLRSLRDNGLRRAFLYVGHLGTRHVEAVVQVVEEGKVLRSGDRSKNPGGSGGFPFDKASAAVGKQIVDYKTARIADTILQVVKAK
jgi:hypothetical protein